MISKKDALEMSLRLAIPGEPSSDTIARADAFMKWAADDSYRRRSPEELLRPAQSTDRVGWMVD